MQLARNTHGWILATKPRIMYILPKKDSEAVTDFAQHFEQN